MNTDFIDFCERLFFVICFSLFLVLFGFILINKIKQNTNTKNSAPSYFYEDIDYNYNQLKKINKIVSK